MTPQTAGGAGGHGLPRSRTRPRPPRGCSSERRQSAHCCPACSPQGPSCPPPHVSAPPYPGLPTPPLPIALQSQVRVASSTSSPASLLPSKDLKGPSPDGSGSARWGAHPEGQAAHLCHVSHLPGSQPPAKLKRSSARFLGPCTHLHRAARTEHSQALTFHASTVAWNRNQTAGIATWKGKTVTREV